MEDLIHQEAFFCSQKLELMLAAHKDIQRESVDMAGWARQHSKEVEVSIQGLSQHQKHEARRDLSRRIASEHKGLQKQLGDMHELHISFVKRIIGIAGTEERLRQYYPMSPVTEAALNWVLENFHNEEEVEPRRTGVPPESAQTTVVQYARILHRQGIIDHSDVARTNPPVTVTQCLVI